MADTSSKICEEFIDGDITFIQAIERLEKMGVAPAEKIVLDWESDIIDAQS